MVRTCLVAVPANWKFIDLLWRRDFNVGVDATQEHNTPIHEDRDFADLTSPIFILVVQLLMLRSSPYQFSGMANCAIVLVASNPVNVITMSILGSISLLHKKSHRNTPYDSDSQWCHDHLVLRSACYTKLSVLQRKCTQTLKSWNVWVCDVVQRIPSCQDSFHIGPYFNTIHTDTAACGCGVLRGVIMAINGWIPHLKIRVSAISDFEMKLLIVM